MKNGEPKNVKGPQKRECGKRAANTGRMLKKLRPSKTTRRNAGVSSHAAGLVHAAVPVMPQTDLLQRTFDFACRSIDLYRHLVKRGGAGRALARQFLNAATSVGANEEEAQAAASKVDFVAKQSIVLREARESQYWLRLFENCNLGDLQLIRPLRQEAGELVGIFTAIVKRSRGNESH